VPTVLRYAGLAMVASISALVSAGAFLRLSDGGAPELWVARAEARVAALGAPQASPTADGVPKGSDGHYWAQGEVNGARVRFLVDTGATEVALTAQDAQRLGIDVARLDYRANVLTATGSTRAAAVRLPSVTVAGARIENVDALVIEKGLDASLLGMSYLGRLSSFQGTPQALFLRP
jgi:aspartyl protease family protein